MKSYRPIVQCNKLWFGMIFLCIMVFAFNCAAAVFVETVSTKADSGPRVSSWARLDAADLVVEAGVTIPFELLRSPPEQPGKGPANAIVVLPFPEIVRKSTFLNHFELNWEKHGHEPPVFKVPHFDFHFYSIPPDEVMKIGAQDPLQPAEDLIPAGYIYPGRDFSVPQMGVHAVRPADLDRQFSDVLIFGFYGGKMMFIEPMVTRDRMLEKKDLTYDIPVPRFAGHVARYPTKIDIRYDGKANAYHITFSGFITGGPSNPPQTGQNDQTGKNGGSGAIIEAMR